MLLLIGKIMSVLCRHFFYSGKTVVTRAALDHAGRGRQSHVDWWNAQWINGGSRHDADETMPAMATWLGRARGPWLVLGEGPFLSTFSS
jgi:hypothetical protein